MTRADVRWEDRARRLADCLADSGDIQDAAWRDALASIPRHELVPTMFEQLDDGHWAERSTSTPEGLDLAYSPTTLVTALTQRSGYQESVSSSTKPDLMMRMLDMLDLRDEHRVLEIGTGTGYNAALLCHRLGEHQVFSVDIDQDLVDLARDRLANIGYRPTLAATDGAHGLPRYAPYDRVLATCAAARIPWAWIQQTRPGALILADLKLAVGAGNLVLLRRTDNGAEGRFARRWAAFMTMRHHRPTPQIARTPREDSGAQTRRYSRSGLPIFPWQHQVPWFLAQIELPQGVTFGYHLDPQTSQPRAGTISAPDGSTAHIADDERQTVLESGPTRLWEPIVESYRRWRSLGEPGWPRLGLTVSESSGMVWLDSPGSRTRWTLPDRG